jgi:hypothetical protein
MLHIYRIFNFLLLTVLFAAIDPAHAEEAVPDRFKIAIGGYTLSRYDTTMSLTEPNLGVGLSIRPDDTLGLERKQTVLQLSGYYRFSNKHALTYSWYSISSQGNKKLEEEFDWIDENGDTITIPVGATVDTSLDYDIYKIAYLWSFYHTDKVELSAGAGLHVTRIAVGLQTDTTSSGVDAEDIATTVPLPVFSFRLTYNVTPRFSWGLKTEAFALKYDEWDGVYTDSSLAMEYRVVQNVGLGAGVSSNSLKVIQDTSKYTFVFDNRITGLLLYVAAYF